MEEVGNKELSGHTGRQVSYSAYAYVETHTRTSYIVLCNDANNPYTDKVLEGMVH